MRTRVGTASARTGKESHPANLPKDVLAARTSKRTDRLVLAGTVLVALGFLIAGDRVKWPLEDFGEYWAAGKLVLAGADPYDPAQVLREQRAIVSSLPSAVMMFNPPWTLPIAAAMGVLPFHAGRSVWLALQLLFVLWCAIRLWALYGGEPRHAVRAAAVALLWMPTIVALRFGQLSPLILLGLVGFLWSLHRGREFTAGLLFGLTAVKPQLVALVWVAFACSAITERRWKTLVGFAASVAGLSLAAVLIDPEAFAQYARLMTAYRPTFTFESPNLATLLRVAFGGSSDWPQYLPTMLGAVLVVDIWRRRTTPFDWRLELPWLVIASCLATSYGGWPFDLVVLLIPILAEATRLIRVDDGPGMLVGASGFVVISGVAFALHQAQVPQATFVWMVPSVAVALYAVRRTGAPAGRGPGRVRSHASGTAAHT